MTTELRTETTLRAATEQELQRILPLGMPGYETWCQVAVDREQVVGHVCLSRARGQVVGHTWAYWGADPRAAARLLLCARKQLRAWRPDERLAIHFTPQDGGTLEFWIRRGFSLTVALFERI